MDFTGHQREEARLAVLDELRAALEVAEPKVLVTLKEWIDGFQLLPSKGFEGFPEELQIVQHLSHSGPQPKPEPATYRYVEGDRSWTGETTFLQAAKDVSALVVLDAITSQHDRWPGHNVHFRLTERDRFRRGAEPGVVEGGPARPMSLDNGDSFVASQRRAFGVLRKYVGRFDRDLVSRLYDLYDWLLKRPGKAAEWLLLDKADFWRFRVAVARTIQEIDAQTDRHPEGAWFTGR